jgi:hypothetical protein
MRLLLSTVLVTSLLGGPIDVWAAQNRSAVAAESTAWKAVAAAIPLGSRVQLHTTHGKRMTATLISVTDEALVLKKHTRLPEPAMVVRYDEVATLERHEGSDGMSVGKAIGVGLAAGAGAILTLFVIMLGVAD